jgi:hypothetical protein
MVEHKFGGWASEHRNQGKPRENGGQNVRWWDLWIVYVFFGFALVCGLIGACTRF